MNDAQEPKPRKRLAAAGLVAVGLVTGGILAGSQIAGAAGGSTPSSSSPGSSSASSNGSGRPAMDPATVNHGPGEKLLTGSTASKVKAAALDEYPGATVIRVETDSGDAVYEAHLRTANGSYVTVLFDKSFNVTGTEDGFGPGPGGMRGQFGPPPGSNGSGSGSGSDSGSGSGSTN